MNNLASVVLLLLITACLGIPNQGDYNYEDYRYEEATDNETKIDEEETVVEKGLPVFIERPRILTVKEGGSIEMPCKTVGDTPHVLIFKKITQADKGDSLIFVGAMKVDKEANFTYVEKVFKLNRAVRGDAGTYVCLYQTTPKTELKYELDVQFPPSIDVNGPVEKHIEKGSGVTLECQAKGNPKPVITWTKESGKFPSGVTEERGFSITLEEVDRHVEGSYICTADNGIDNSASAKIQVLVEYPPEIITEKAIIRTGEGDKVELVCIVHARPAADVYWTKDGGILSLKNEVTESEGGHRHAITINKVTESEFGAYQCQAQNSKGDSSGLINLTDLPMQPHFTSPATSADETSYILVWETESYYPITEYVVNIKPSKPNRASNVSDDWIEYSKVVLGGEGVETNGLRHKMTHVFQELIPAMNYEARVKVKNTLKWGEEESFNFSTRKETVGRQQTAGSEAVLVNVWLCIVSLFLSFRN